MLRTSIHQDSSRKRARAPRLLPGPAFCLAALLMLASSSPAQASAPTPIFGIQVGGEGVVLSDGIGPALGVRAGIRLHPGMAFIADAHVAIEADDVAQWNVLGGVRLCPLLQPHARIDLDIQAGGGNSGAGALGAYVLDGQEVERFFIGRVEFTLLRALSTRVGFGPRLRYEIQPVFVREVGHLPGGAEASADRLDFHGHQILAALAFEADAAKQIGHVSWDVGGGVAISGDGRQAGAILRAMFTWYLDLRPARSRAGR